MSASKKHRGANPGEFPIVRVDWEDAQSTEDQAWKPLGQLCQDLLERIVKPCVTVGFLVYEDKRHIIVVASLGHADADVSTEASGDCCIPKAWIRKLTYLKG